MNPPVHRGAARTLRSRTARLKRRIAGESDRAVRNQLKWLHAHSPDGRQLEDV